MQTEENKYTAAERLKLGRPNAQAIESVRNMIRGQSFESAFAWDARGNLVTARDGLATRVMLKKLEYEQARGGIILHSHPNQTPFSGNDLAIAKNFRLSRMEVVSRKYLYFFEPPVNGWGRVSAAIWDDELSRMEEKYDKIKAKAKAGQLSGERVLEEMDKELLLFATRTRCHYARIVE